MRRRHRAGDDPAHAQIGGEVAVGSLEELEAEIELGLGDTLPEVVVDAVRHVAASAYVKRRAGTRGRDGSPGLRLDGTARRIGHSCAMRDDFPQALKDKLAKRVGFVCSNPDCRAPTVAAALGSGDKAVNVGIAAHICAASPGGPRFDGSSTPEQRSSMENAVWLCSVCAKKIDDDEHKYSVATLRHWRAVAESSAHASVGRPPGTGGGAAASAPHPSPSTVGEVFPVLPHFTSLKDDTGDLVGPLDTAIWIDPGPVGLDVPRAMARAALRAAGSRLIPLVHGREQSGPHSHPRFGKWISLWAVDASDRQVRNERVTYSLGVSEGGVLAFQKEHAWYGNNVDIVHLDELLRRVADLVESIWAFYQQIDGLTDSQSMRINLAVDTPRPDATVIEGQPFFGWGIGDEIALRVTSDRQRVRVGFRLADTERPEGRLQLIASVLNQFVGACDAHSRAIPRGGRSPTIASIQVESVAAFLGGRSSVR